MEATATGHARRAQAAAGEAQARAEVAGVLADMLSDLEAWAAENEWRRCRAALAAQEREIGELHAEVAALTKERDLELEHNRARAAEAKAIRETFVTELWALSKQLKSSAAAEKKLKHAEREQSQLAKVQRELDACQRELRQLQGGGVAGAAASVHAAHRQVDPPETVIAWIQSALGGKKWKKDAERYGLQLCQAGQTSIFAVTRMSATHLRDLGLTPAHATLVSSMPPPNSPVSAFAAPFLVLEDKALLKMFSFLTANNVLGAAQVCRPFLTRVDALFGMGSNVVTAAPRAQPTPPASQRLMGADAGGPTSGGRQGGATTDATSGGGVGPKVGLSAALATQIAAKLNVTEMKGIIQMTERIKKLEAFNGQLNEAKEDVESRLQATESVKEFLVTKLKDTEMALKRTIDGANETARQHQADQEVINFLDSRVQDLERQLKTALVERDSLRDNLNSTEETTKNQVKTLEDMLHWEQERSAKQEAEAKSQKKLLVKEVKALRVQLSQMTTERDAYKQQARTLQLRAS